MNQHTKLEGLIAAPFTPIHPNGAVNLDMIPAQADLLARNGVAGAFICGTTGEGMSLTVTERKAVAKRWVEAAPEGFPVIVHVGHTSIEASKDLVTHAQAIGAAAASLMPPCFFRPACLDDLLAYCAEISATVPDFPMYYYHIPSLTGVRFSMADFLAAASATIGNLVGVKYTHEDLMDLARCQRVSSGAFDVLFGRDEMLLSALALGTRGAVGSTYNFAAPLYGQLIRAFDNGDLDAAREFQHTSIELIQLLCSTSSSFLPAAKSVMRMLGVDCGPVRLPLQSLTADEYDVLEAELRTIGFFDYCAK